ncbi:MAG: nucleotide exchange factor GrpE [Candidatus Omnitrophica bacterium]|nr:nucleotide exchange factor GrpE [Candidatus Omnitrophota bacterium]
MSPNNNKEKDSKNKNKIKETSQQEAAQQPQTLELLQDQLLRLGAEFENYKKRVQREREDLIRYAGETFILELLHIVDNFERAFQAADKTQDFKVLHKGVEMILKEVEEFLAEKGVKKIETVGKQFDPHKHEAIEQIVCADKEENTIVEELQAGYELNGRVIRPAKVKISKARA